MEGPEKRRKMYDHGMEAVSAGRGCQQQVCQPERMVNIHDKREAAEKRNGGPYSVSGGPSRSDLIKQPFNGTSTPELGLASTKIIALMTANRTNARP